MHLIFNFGLGHAGVYFMQKQWTKLNSVRSKTLVHSHYLTPLTSQTSLSHTVLVYICSNTFGCSSSISLSKAGTNEAGLCVWGAVIQGAPSWTLRCYFNVGSCNCVEQARFFSSGSNRGQPPQQPSDPWPASRGGPGLRPVWSSTCWENFTQETLLDSSLKAGGFRSQGPLCVKVNNTESGKSLCLGAFFKCVFEADLWQVNTTAPHSGQWH